MYLMSFNFRGFRGRKILVISRTLNFADGDYFLKNCALLILRSAYLIGIYKDVKEMSQQKHDNDKINSESQKYEAVIPGNFQYDCLIIYQIYVYHVC